MKRQSRAGLLAGLASVGLTTAFILISQPLGFLPEGMDMRAMAVGIDSSAHPALALVIGIINHVLAGGLIGFLYGRFASRFTVISGIACMLMIWPLLMLVGLPVTGRGYFGMSQGPALAIGTFILFVLFGIAMARFARHFSRGTDA